MATGRVLQFDHARGYGFVAADDGGEDVFLHASVIDGDPEEITPGTKMEFKVMAGDRGRKAFAAHLLDDEPDSELVPRPRPVPPPQPGLGPRLGPMSPPTPSPGAAPSPPPAPRSTEPASQRPGKDQATDDDQMCDVLSPAEFGQELTELLVSSVPALTGQQILGVRAAALELAKRHGWVDV